MYYYGPKTLIHATQASRTIHPSEEITIPYINILQPRADRQSALSNYWGSPALVLCALVPQPIVMHLMRGFDGLFSYRIPSLTGAGKSIGPPSTAEKLIDLYDQEGIHAAKGIGHMFAALAYNAVGDTNMARSHAEKALEAGLVNNGHGGEGDGDRGEMRSLLGWPEERWSFMTRRR
jgi:hypothetical protein